MIHIDNRILEHLIKLAAAYYPREMCGVFTGRKLEEDDIRINNFHWVPNISKREEQWNYLMDPQAYHDILLPTVVDKRIKVVGIFHTHPRGKNIPSLIDIEEAERSGERVPYLIYSPLNGFAFWNLSIYPVRVLEWTTF